MWTTSCINPSSVNPGSWVQAELIVGDQSGVIHIWDLKTDHNEQLIPEADVSINSVHIDPDASYMAAVNSSVRRAGSTTLQGGWGWWSTGGVLTVYVLCFRVTATCGT